MQHRWLLLLSLSLCFGCVRAADNYPVKPIHFLVPFTPGGTGDILARVIGQKLGEAWGQQIVVENRGGAGGTIGMEYARRQAPDGYSFVVISNTVVISQMLYPKPGYDSARDFLPVLYLGASPMVLAANPTRTSIGSIGDLVSVARRAPGRLTYGECATGSAHHVAMETLKYEAKIDVRHIGYRGCAPAVVDAVAGQTDLVLASSTAVLPQVRAGKLRAVAVTARARSPAAPDVPTVAESGVPGLQGFAVDNWYAMMAPLGTPSEILAKMAGAVSAALTQPDVRDKLGQSGIDVRIEDAEALRQAVNRDAASFKSIIEYAGIKID